MKKMIPAGIAAIGVVGLLGLGATAASAATPHVTVSGSACATIASDMSALSIQEATANSTLSAAESNFSAVGSAVASDSATFATDFNTYIQAIQNNTPLGGPLATLTDADNALVHDLGTWGTDEVAVQTAQRTVNSEGVSSSLLSDMSEALGC